MQAHDEISLLIRVPISHFSLAATFLPRVRSTHDPVPVFPLSSFPVFSFVFLFFFSFWNPRHAGSIDIHHPGKLNLSNPCPAILVLYTCLDDAFREERQLRRWKIILMASFKPVAGKWKLSWNQVPLLSSILLYTCACFSI